MNSKAVTIINKLGLHARAAAKLVGLASRFDAEVFVEKSSAKVNGKSIMGVMMLAAGKGSEIKIIAEGPDEAAAVEALVQLVNDRFGEAE